MSGKHMAKTNRNAKNRKKPLSLLVLLLVLAGMVVGGTVAYLLTATNAITNTFTPASTTPDIVEKFDGTEKSEIIIKNTGDAAAYIRVALVGKMVDGSGNEVNVALTQEQLGSGWVLHTDGYYYYTTPVAGGKPTVNLLAEGVTIKVAEGQTVTVLAQSIQAEPAAAVLDAWDVNPSTLS